MSSPSLEIGGFDFRKIKSLRGGQSFIHHTEIGHLHVRWGDNGNQNGTGGTVI